ncbi:MAG: molecular chaperone DnaJ [Parcubacteria group bacterium]|nr:molecular chaperone DnaJ [Parcubacteria group bacterium]
MDYYSLLGISKNASPEDIKKAFRKLAAKHHPDKPGGNAAKFKEINEAYQVLSDPEKRNQYDQLGHSAYRQSGNGGAGFSWEDFMRQGGETSNSAHFDFGNFGDIFDDFFGGTRAQTRSKKTYKGRDREMKIQITFLESALGTQKEISFVKDVTCTECHGSGGQAGTAPSDCGECHGSGQRRTSRQTFFGNFATLVPCEPCEGTGKIYAKKCTLCGGKGINRSNVTLKVKIPAGIENGQTLRLSAEGDAAKKGGIPGDVYIHISVKTDPYFFRKEQDVHTKLHISPTLAVLGGKAEVKTIEGNVMIKIPAGTQSGATFRLRGLGIARLHGRGRGDHHVEIGLAIPKKTTAEEKKLWKQISDMSGEDLHHFRDNTSGGLN